MTTVTGSLTQLMVKGSPTQLMITVTGILT